MKTFGTDEDCRAHMQSVRWPHGSLCPKCGTINDAAPVGGRPGLFRCKACKSQFTVTVRTAMEGSHLPLNIWYLTMYLIMSAAKPISAMSLSRQMQIRYRTYRHRLHCIRATLERGDKLRLAGVILADESYVGGRATNRQKHRPAPTRGHGTDKSMVFAAVERDGEARTAVVKSASATALDPLMYRWFDRDSILCTD
jgi:transposase-like protein